MTNKKLYLIDGNAYFYRAYYALPPLVNSQGLPVNAVYGFTRMMLKIIQQENPYYLVVCFDSPHPTFRHKEYVEYKANRPAMPEDLKVQIPLCKRIVESLSIPFFQKEGYEADDLIATISGKAEREGIETVIISNDKDMLQLVNEKITVLDELKNVVYDNEEVKHILGIEPGQIVDFMGLAGDSVDNIPGIPGIGNKTAVKLIQKYGTIENLKNKLPELKGKIKEKIENFLPMAEMSRGLVILVKNVPVDIEISDCKFKKIEREKFLKILKEFEFKNLISEWMPEEENISDNYQIITGEKEFERILKKSCESEKVFFKIQTTDSSPLNAQIVSLIFTFEDGKSVYFPLAHNYEGCPGQLKTDYVLAKLKFIFENEKIKKYGQDLKFSLIVLKQKGIDLCGIGFDLMVAAYLLNPSKQKYPLENIILEYLNLKTTTIADLIKKEKKEVSKIKIEKIAILACRDTKYMMRLTEILNSQLKKKELDKLFYQIEIPLLKILAQMQMEGILLDTDYLEGIGVELEHQIEELKKEIYIQSGEEFNINSPKQLRVILFEKLKLPIIKKTKTGASTSEDILKKLSFSHTLPVLILKYRGLQKLKSTYVDGLLKLVDSKTKRIHSSFNQTITATGRLSSSDPNLQNIPVRTKMGKVIRKAFIAQKGCVFISLDYSQIDLRVLAHFSKDVNLKKAFCCGNDVHSQTAREIFNIPLEKINQEERKTAKIINFGIIYGMSSYGLAQELGISQIQAQEYIEKYFIKYEGVKKFIDKAVTRAKKDGYVLTLFNRRRYLPEIQSENRILKEFAERVAINMPIQGTSADIIKMAMVQIDFELKNKNLKSKMLLQIHDELIFEVPQEEKEVLLQVAKEKMENAVKLDVPIKVNIKTGENWGSMGSNLLERM